MEEDSLRLPDICPGHPQLIAEITASRAAMDQSIALIQQDQKQNNRMTEEILKIVKGRDGNIGLTTQAELNMQAIANQDKSLKVIWYWITSISGSIVVLAGFAIRGLISP